jgi:uncharacterized protein with GYD domain
MATYILLANYTEKGIGAIKDSPKRADAARELGKKVGVDMKTVYLCMGAYDLIAILEAPNTEAVAKFVLTLGSKGNVRTTTVEAFPEAQYRSIIASLPG